MDTRVLKYFLVVAQEESLSRAAAVLHTSQPNLSRQLADLEDRLGRKLFIRGSRKITLTEEGMFLRRRAREITDLLNRTENDLKSFEAQTGGTVHIGAIETVHIRFLASSMLEMQRQYPNVAYDFFSGSVAELNEVLDKGLLDFALLVAPVQMHKYDYIRLPLQDRFGLLMRNDHPLAEQDAVRAQDVGQHPVWVARQQLESNVLSGWLGRDVKTLNIAATFNLITNPAALVEAGVGMAFTFDGLVCTSGRALCFKPLEPPLEAALYLVWKKQQVFGKAAEIFLRHLRAGLAPGAEART